MKDIFIDVLLELDTLSLTSLPDPTRFIYERARDEADRRCEENKARLRTDRAPEVIVNHGKNPLTGDDVTLVATRWAVVAPERGVVHRVQPPGGVG